jgi:outer membrane protein OmpA-like peptidoglycan-associated protein
MRYATFRSSTAMFLAVALALPQGGFAQGLPKRLAGLPGSPDLPRVDDVLQICALQDPPPCVLPNGKIAENAKRAEAAAEVEGAIELGERLRAADAAVLAGGTVAVEAEVEPEAEVVEEPVAEAEPEAPVAEEPVAEAEPEVPVAEEPVAEATAEPVAEPAEAAAEPAPETSPRPKKADRAGAQGDDLADAVKKKRKDRAKEGDAAVTEEPVKKVAGETTEARNDAGLTEAGAEAEAEQQDEEQAATATVAAGSADAEAEAAPSETVTVTEADVRSSDQDVAKPTAEEAAATAQKRKGLSPLETIALLGAGALIVGAIMNNGDRVISSSGDRAVVERDDGTVYVLKDDDALLRQPGAQVTTRRFDDGSTITTVKRQNGTEVRTVRDATGRVLRRTKVLGDGTSVELFDDTREVASVDVSTLPKSRADEIRMSDRGALEAALRRDSGYDLDRRFSLGQIRNIRAVRELVPTIDLDAITFETGSAAIRVTEAEKLADLGVAMRDLLDERPGEVFLIEGHTDAVGSASSNLTLSDRRAESLALALTEYFDIPPENLVVQGYGESYLKVPVLDGERANRRVAVRRITPLLTGVSG